MKAVIFFLLTLLSFTAFAQFPTIQQDGTPNTMKCARGAYGVDSGFVYRYAFPDTSKASIGFLKNIPGITIMVNDTVFFRSRDAKKWVKMGTGSSGSSSGGISNIELNEGFGIFLTPSPIDSTGSIAVDSTVIATRNYSDSNYNDVEQLDDSTFLIKRPNGTKDTIQILTGSSIAGSSGIDSIWRVAGIDSFYWRKSGIAYRVKDSTGGGVGGITLIQMNDSLALYIKASDSILKYVTKQAMVDSINSRAVVSFAGRKGAVTPDETDYASYYPRLSQSYSNPIWIFDLPWSKITGTSGVMLKSDSSTYQSRYGADTGRVNVYQQFSLKVNISDSGRAPTNWATGAALNKVRDSLQSNITSSAATKLNITDSGRAVTNWVTGASLNKVRDSAVSVSLPVVGGTLTGTAGAGFIGLPSQSSAPSTPSSGTRIYSDASNRLAWQGTNGWVRTFDGTSNTGDRNYTLPNVSGTLPVGTGTANEISYWSGTNTIGSLTTATYPSLTELSYLKGVTSSVQTQIDAKDNKSSASYTFHANNTGSTANMTDQVFRKAAEATYSGTITWAGTTAPSGSTNHTFRWTQIGNMVYLWINLDYSVAGSALTSVTVALPSDCPAPYEPNGIGAANDWIGLPGSGQLMTLRSSGNRNYVQMRVNSGDTGWEMNLPSSSGNYRYAQLNIVYMAQ